MSEKKRERAVPRFLSPGGKKSMTKQSFKKECDVNVILKKYGQTGVIPHINASPGVYADVSNVPDFATAHNMVVESQARFNTLSKEVRAKFRGPLDLLAFLSDGKNRDEAIRLGLVNKPAAPTAPAPAIAGGPGAAAGGSGNDKPQGKGSEQ